MWDRCRVTCSFERWTKAWINTNGVERGRGAALAYLSAPDRLMALSGRWRWPQIAGNLCAPTKRRSRVDQLCKQLRVPCAVPAAQMDLCRVSGPLIRKPLGMECNGRIYTSSNAVTLQCCAHPTSAYTKEKSTNWKYYRIESTTLPTCTCSAALPPLDPSSDLSCAARSQKPPSGQPMVHSVMALATPSTTYSQL